MKNALIIIGSIIFIVVFFVIGMFFWPFMAYLTGSIVFPYPLILSILSLLGFIICKIKKASWSFVFIPLFLCNVCETIFCHERYFDRHYKGTVIRANSISGRLFLANQFGINILPSNSCLNGYTDNETFINDDFVVCEDGYDNKGIFSIKYQEMVVPFGQTLAGNGQSFSQGTYEGVKTSNDIVVIPAIYEYVKVCTNCIVVKKNGKYGVLDNMGRQSSHYSFILGIHYDTGCHFSEFYTKEDRFEHEYLILEDNHNYLGAEYKYHILDTDGFRHVFSTSYEVDKVETKDVFILRNSDYKYGMRGRDKSVPCSYNDYYGYDSSSNTYKFLKRGRYSYEDDYMYYFNERGEQVDKKVW